MPEKLLTIREYCELAQCSPSTVFREMQRGHLKYIKIGRLTRIPADALRVTEEDLPDA